MNKFEMEEQEEGVERFTKNVGADQLSSSDSEEEPPELIGPDEVEKARENRPVPVTIITGFLGSGKSTLLRYILNADHGLRIAVIENEFGDSMDIENIIATDGTNGERIAGIFELRNGCVCCSVKDDLVQTLEYLLGARARAGLAFDRVVIETTGLADPGPVASVLWVDEELESQVCLDGIVTLVDARNITKHLAPPSEAGAAIGGEVHSKEAKQQIAYADRVLLNKIDLVSESELGNVHGLIRAINSECAVLKTKFSQVPDLALILDIQTVSSASWTIESADEDKRENNNIFAVGEQQQPCCSGSVACGHKKKLLPLPAAEEAKKLSTTLAAVHDPEVCTVRLVVVGEVRSLELVERWLAGLLWEGEKMRNRAWRGRREGGDLNEAVEHISLSESRHQLMDIYRIKGILSVHGAEPKYLLQAVHELFDLVPLVQDRGQPDEQTETIPEEQPAIIKLVFIGRFLNREKLLEGIQSCCMEGSVVAQL